MNEQTRWEEAACCRSCSASQAACIRDLTLLRAYANGDARIEAL
jgi:hypothetical protein